MVSRQTLRTALLGRDITIAYAIIVALYLLKFIRFQPVQIPPYLLIATYDLVEVTLPFLTPYHPIGFPLFLYALAVIGAGITRRLHRRDSDRSAWVLALGGICLVIGTLSLIFGAVVGGPVIAPSDNPTPLAITGTTGVLCLLAGWWVLRRPSAPALAMT